MTNNNNTDIAFCRALLREAHKIVKSSFPDIDLRTGAWTYHFHRDSWEFHGPEGFYWNGHASNAYETRYKGWMAWLKHKGVDT